MSTLTTLERGGRCSLLSIFWMIDSGFNVCKEDYKWIWKMRKWMYEKMEWTVKWEYFKCWENSRIEGIVE